MNLNVGLLGGGSWGTTVASLVARKAPIMMWARDNDVVTEINENHTNSKYLPGAILSSKLKATIDLEQAVSNMDVIVVGIPSQNFRSVLIEVKKYIRPWVPVISLSKGLEHASSMRMTQVIDDVLPGHPRGVLTGPNLAKEIMAGYAAASVMAMEDQVIVKELQKLFHSGLFRVYTNHDVIGCELGGVLKNIIAIAAGMGDGQGAGDNTRSSVITRGLAEITRLGVAMGGEAQTFAGLTGMGDLVATCTSAQSRNRTVGFELGQGKSIDDIIASMFMVAEGVKSAPAVMALAEQHDIQMPIAEEVHAVVTGKSDAKKAFKGLLRAHIGAESEPG